MDAANLREYVAGDDRRRAARLEAREAEAARALSLVPMLAALCRERGAAPAAFTADIAEFRRFLLDAAGLRGALPLP